MRNIIILLLLFPVALEAQTLSIWGVENDTVEIGKNIKTNKWIANLETGVIYQLSHAVTKTQTLSSVGDSGWITQKFPTFAQHTAKANTASPTFTGIITAPVYRLTTTDTVSLGYDVGTIMLRINETDTSLWLKIRNTGTIVERWKKLTQ